MARSAEKIKEFESRKAEWADSIIQARWIKDGDKCSRLFFRSFKQMSKATELTAVISENGTILNRWEDMASEAVSHFEKLFSQVQDEDPASLEQVLDSQLKSKSVAERQEMEKPLTLSELHTATKAVPLYIQVGRKRTYDRKVIRCCKDCDKSVGVLMLYGRRIFKDCDETGNLWETKATQLTKEQ